MGHQWTAPNGKYAQVFVSPNWGALVLKKLRYERGELGWGEEAVNEESRKVESAKAVGRKRTGRQS